MLRAFALLLLFTPSALGAIIYQTSGQEAVQYAISTSEAIAVSWSSTVSYSNVSIVVPLDSGLNNTQTPQAGEAFLLDSIGAGATQADVLAQTTFDFPADTIPDQAIETLFSGLSLNAGTYYLLLDSASSTGGGWQATNASDLTVTTASGVTSGGDFYTLTPNQTFAPASTFTPGLVYDPLVTVSGTVSAPEPATDLLILGPILFLAGLRHRWKAKITTT